MSEKIEDMRVEKFITSFFDLTNDTLLGEMGFPEGKQTNYYSDNSWESECPHFQSTTNDYAGLELSGGYDNWLCPLVDAISEYYNSYTLSQQSSLVASLVEAVLIRDLSMTEKELVNLATQLYVALTNQLARHYTHVNSEMFGLRKKFSIPREPALLEGDHLIENAKLALYLIDSNGLEIVLRYLEDSFDDLLRNKDCTKKEKACFDEIIALCKKYN